MNIGRKNQFLTNINHRQWMDKFFHQNDCTIGLKAGHGTKKWKGLFAGALLPNNESLDAKRIVTGKVALYQLRN